MTVSELSRLLKNYPPGMRVVVQGYEDGFDDLSPEQMVVVEIQLNQGTKDWQGRHLNPTGQAAGAPTADDVVDALALFRSSH